ncbi:hypothetical protein SAMN05444007_103387 [Cribrihabitans marinus]|uniref:Uncharacterized protein n=1 Tax=Cribrihabitans marinus TaxID=1227549 RepID=A0A1H6WKM1_9RHOB|nr:hypothetical protein [Cribrihabitans marinus]GGH24506.1 hypothetical protein GCM10010973_11060 [Cribrihabitans marinus]SEJ12915.1 hypothetical protein SAMN05444007_103387 [Cribrihabitans marinus]
MRWIGHALIAAALIWMAGSLYWNMDVEGFGRGFCAALAFAYLAREGRAFLDDDEGGQG